MKKIDVREYRDPLGLRFMQTTFWYKDGSGKFVRIPLDNQFMVPTEQERIWRYIMRNKPGNKIKIEVCNGKR